MEFPPQKNYRTTVWPSNSTAWYCAKKMETIIQKDTHTQMFIGALFIIAKIWKQAKCSSTDKWIKKMWYVSHKKEWNSAICNNMDGPRGNYS